MAYPSVITTLSNPQATDRLNNPSHSQLHQNENAGITEIQTFVGTLSSAVGTMIYDVRSPNSNGGGHVQTAITGGTGQTSFNKGDVLIAQSSSVLTKLAVGADQTVLTADSSQAVGVKWGTGATTNTQSFVSNGVWVKPTGASPNSRVLVELWGAGGSGAATSGSGGAGGGGGGAYVSGIYSASILASSVLIAVGRGGSSVVATNSGNPGTPTVFDPINSILGAGFGGGGGQMTAANGGGGGGGGQGTNLVPNGGNNGLGTTGGAGGTIGFAVIGQGTGGDSGAAGSVAAFIGGISGGGGGGAAARNGGYSAFGGGGGGGIHSSAFGVGGNSGGGGVGTSGSVVGTGAQNLAGGFPAGGSGAASGSGALSGNGGNGFAIVTTFL